MRSSQRRFSSWSLILLLGTFGFLVLSFGEGSSGAPTLPACKGGLIAEGFTYRFRDPRRGEIVNFHIRGRIGEPVAPDPNGDDFITKRVIGVPGDRVTWQNSRALIDGHKADDIPTPEFAPVRLGNDEYFVIGDNRSYSQDSRDFGPLPAQSDLLTRHPPLVAPPPLRPGRVRQEAHAARARVLQLTCCLSRPLDPLSTRRGSSLCRENG